MLEKDSLRNSSSVYIFSLSEHLDYEYLLGPQLYNLFTWKMEIYGHQLHNLNKNQIKIFITNLHDYLVMHIYRPFLYISIITRKGLACDALCGMSRYYMIPYLRSDCRQYFSSDCIIFKNFNISPAYYNLDFKFFSKLSPENLFKLSF